MGKQNVSTVINIAHEAILGLLDCHLLRIQIMSEYDQSNHRPRAVHS